jgi:hypothetical protein
MDGKVRLEVRVAPKIKEVLKEISRASEGKLNMSYVVEMFLREALEKRGMLPSQKEVEQ